MGKAGCVGILALVALLAVGVVMWGTGVYNGLVREDEAVNGAWAQVENAYQRRADLIPNLVATVEGAADFERGTLTEVIEARSRATQVQLNADQLDDPAALARFQQAQDALGSALGRLLVVVERYPDLKANQNFLQLQDELAGTENRIGIARQDFNQAAQSYNTMRRAFPAALIAGFFGFAEKAYFQSRPGSDEPPQVEFKQR